MKKIVGLFALVLIAATTQFGCATAADVGVSELEQFQKAIRARYDGKERAFAEDDPNWIVDEFYSSDVISVDFESNVHKGREALRPIYQEVVPGSTVRIESVQSHVEGSTGWDYTNFYVTLDDASQEPFSFVILFLWQQREGKWWSVGEMYVMGEIT